ERVSHPVSHMTQSAVVLDFVQQFDDVGLSDFADQAMPERRENVVMQAALDVPVALESLDVDKIIRSYIAHGPCPGFGLPPFLGLAFFRRKQIDTFRGRVADVTSAPAGVSETEGRVGAKNTRPLPLPPRPIAEQPIAQSLGVLAAVGIDPQA